MAKKDSKRYYSSRNKLKPIKNNKISLKKLIQERKTCIASVQIIKTNKGVRFVNNRHLPIKAEYIPPPRNREVLNETDKSLMDTISLLDNEASIKTDTLINNKSKCVKKGNKTINAKKNLRKS